MSNISYCNMKNHIFVFFTCGGKKKLKTITNCFHFIKETGAPVWSTDFKRYSLSSLLGFDSESESFFLRCSLPFSPDHWGRSRPVMDEEFSPQTRPMNTRFKRFRIENSRGCVNGKNTEERKGFFTVIVLSLSPLFEEKSLRVRVVGNVHFEG